MALGWRVCVVHAWMFPLVGALTCLKLCSDAKKNGLRGRMFGRRAKMFEVLRRRDNCWFARTTIFGSQARVCGSQALLLAVLRIFGSQARFLVRKLEILVGRLGSLVRRLGFLVRRLCCWSCCESLISKLDVWFASLKL